MRQVFFRRQTRDGVSTSQHTVTGNEFLYVAGWGQETYRLGLLYHAAAQFVPKFTHTP